MHPTVFISPYTNTENPYIALQHELLRDLGYEVRPLSLGALLRGRCGGLARRENAVFVHWLENRVFKEGRSERRLSVSGTAQFLVYLTVLRLSRARVVVFVHDHAVHDVKGSLARVSRGAIRSLARVADARVVHDPASADRYDATYLPHPLYRQPEAGIAPSVHETPQFAAMGAIRPYKALDQALESWPAGVPLLIAGKGETDYVDRLRAIVARRGLEDAVTIDARFMSDDEFLDRLGRQDVLVLPHLEGENLVSGAFFAGVGHVRVVLARETPFILWAQERIPGVVAFEDAAGIGAAVSDIVDRWDGLRTLDLTREAVAEFGEDACRAAYGAFLASLTGVAQVATGAEPAVGAER